MVSVGALIINDYASVRWDSRDGNKISEIFNGRWAVLDTPCLLSNSFTQKIRECI